MATKNPLELPELLELLTKIAGNNLLLDQEETLEMRGSDSLDFHNNAVWGIKEALLQAYELGAHPNGSIAKSLR